MKGSKRFVEISKKVSLEELYPLSKAVALVKECATAKFDESIELVVVLNLDKKKTDQAVRGVVALPHGTGKEVKVAAFVSPDMVGEVKSAGADFVGGEDLIEKVVKGFTDFDYAIASPDMMPSMAKLGQILGPKGLMPNPKIGTVSKDVPGTVKSFKRGTVKFRSDSGCNVHILTGKATFQSKLVEENAKAAVKGICKERPKDVPAGGFVKRAFISSTMGVGIKVDVSSLL